MKTSSDVTLVSGPLVMMSLTISDVTHEKKAPVSSFLSALLLTSKGQFKQLFKVTKLITVHPVFNG